ncbi:uncharacterized protein EDB93DRAFT_1248827 [Suillus bovinus]|uniref:uncharacterized protein n=1 Tax=Suillus bovinus TaxID=48563 RepID=UPI001B88050C|nr:uncharacterized protein EDB93DRAFT_1248827 [Suillus bovinus]KAG2153563.1 hypothetical protein EDB93DRAFT_1248827 [Suillus bovinus]
MVIPPAPRPVAVTRQPSQPIFLGFLRKFLLSSRMDTVCPIRINEPHNPLDFPATGPLPRSIVDHHDNFLPPTIQSSSPTSTSIKSLLRSLSTWRPLQTGHGLPAIVDTPLAHGQNVAAGGTHHKDDEWITEEEYVSSHPPHNPDSQQQTTAGQKKIDSGEHGSNRFCFCF